MTVRAADESRILSFVLGLGCRRGIATAPLLELARATLAEVADGASPIRLRAIASLDRRAEEPALQAVAAYYGVPLLGFSAARLEAETPRLAHPSDEVHAATGCHGVAEGAALAAVGAAGWLAVPKRIGRGATAALAAMHDDLLIAQEVGAVCSQADSVTSSIESGAAGGGA